MSHYKAPFLQIRKIFSLFILLAFTLPALSMEGQGLVSGKTPSREISVQILSINDYHGHLDPPSGQDEVLGKTVDPAGTKVGGSEFLSTLLQQLRAKEKYSITATAGDVIGGSPFLSGLFHDEPAVEALNAMKINVSSVGNHEFDEGVPELLRMQKGGCHPKDGCYKPRPSYRFKGAAFPWLAANAIDKKTGKSILPAVWSKQIVPGVKIGFIGMTLEATKTLVPQTGNENVNFENVVRAATRGVKTLQAQKVQAIVVLIHEGGYTTGVYDACPGMSGPIFEIAKKMPPEIDMIISGHTHQAYICNVPDPFDQPRYVTSAASFGRVVTESLLTINTRTKDVVREKTQVYNHLVTRTVAKDPLQTAIIADWKKISGPIANRLVGAITADIIRDPDRKTESPLANLVADANLAATTRSPASAVIAFSNPGGIRANLNYTPPSSVRKPGEVTYAEAYDVLPFGDQIVTVTMTGDQIRQALEQQYRQGRSRQELILGISSGLSYIYTRSAKQGERISSITLNGNPIDAVANYQVTVDSYLREGKDEFTAFTLGSNAYGGGDELTALTDYLTAYKPVAPPATGRIVVNP